jgi:integrase
MKFTSKSLENLTLPEGKVEHTAWDDSLPGFGVRIRPNSKSWRIQYRVGKQQRSESLGDVRKVDLEAARKIARQRFAMVELGKDPGADRDALRQARAAAELTLGKVARDYLDAKKDAWRASTFKATKRYLEVGWAPLHKSPVDTIKRAPVAARLQELIKQNGRASAARARAVLSALFSWAMKEGLCENNPTVATNDPAAGSKARERVLSDDEIRIIWNACADDDFGRVVKLLLLTGCRRDEIGKLRRSEVNLDTGVMTIPGTRTKNHRQLELPLPPMALEILRSAESAEGREYMFGRRNGMAGWSWLKLALDHRITAALGRPLERWTLHDTRRSMRTGLGKLGIPPHIAELAINHARAGIQAVYDRHSYQPQIKAALASWADHVRAVVEGRSSAKVVPLHA